MGCCLLVTQARRLLIGRTREASLVNVAKAKERKLGVAFGQRAQQANGFVVSARL
jgi:hypothetical protein